MSEFLKPILKAFFDVIAPLEAVLSNEEEFELFLAHYGWDATIDPSSMAAIETAFAVHSLIETAIEKVDELISGDGDRLQATIELLQALKPVVERIYRLSTTSTGGLPFPLDQNQFWNEIGEHLIEDLLANYFEHHQPVFYAFFHLFGIIQYEKMQPTGTGRLNYTRANIHWDKLIDFFAGPGDVFNDLYKWDVAGQGFDHQKLLRVLERIFLSFHLPARLDIPRADLTNTYLTSASINNHQIREFYAPIIEEISPADRSFWSLGFLLLPIPDPEGSANPPSGIMIRPVLQGGAQLSLPLGQDIYLNIGGAFDGSNVLTAKIYPSNVDFETNIGDAEINAHIGLIGAPESPWILIGSENSHRVQLGGFKAEFSVNGRLADPEFGLAIGTGELSGEDPPSLKVVLDFSESDGFIQETAGSEPIVFEFAGNLHWSSKRGVTFEGQAGFEVNQPLRLTLGPISITNLYLAIKAGTLNGKGSLNTAIALSLKLELGPFVAVVENIGLKIGLVPLTNNDQPGAFGNLDLDFGFKPPTGIGLSLDTDVVKGGGYLFFDPDNERYGGALELVIKDQISVTAIGLVTTRFPDGSKGFSLLLIISVQFSPGIALSMGFFLSGLGGLIGIHRTINVEALRDGVKNNAIDHILFPEDVIANITQIITDLRNIFPPKRDQFIIGLMAKITWGVPTLVSIEFGLAVEFANPVRIAILGVVKVVIPTEEAAILRLQINFIGIIDFERGALEFDASLYNSKLLTFTLEGDMAVRLKWKKPLGFVMSMGGFHPAYEAPQHLNLRPMTRLTLTILPDNPRLILTSYFAITSNTVQFGAAIDFYFKVSKFKVIGYFGFDVLFQFSPFMFIASIRAGVEVKLGSSTLLSIKLAFELQGPTPWKATGTASFKILFIKIKVKFSKTWGEKKDTALPPAPVMPKVMEAFQQDRNWQGALPSRSFLLVSLKKKEEGASEAEEQLILQTFSSLTIKQNIIPLDIVLTKFGDFRPQDVNKIRINELLIGDESIDFDYVKDSFAPSTYKEMSNDDKLKAPSYQEEKSGIVARGTDELKGNYAINREVRYEVRSSDHNPHTDLSYYLVEPMVYLDNNSRPLFGASQSNFIALAENGAVGRSALGRQATTDQFRLEGAAIQLQEEQYTIVNNADLARHTGSFTSGTQAEATDALNQIINDNPEMGSQLSILPEYELEEVL